MTSLLDDVIRRCPIVRDSCKLMSTNDVVDRITASRPIYNYNFNFLD